ncbi:MAG: TIGR03067 domain-containing protein, partial [Bacteroidetes bacterium]|nr:TIGR03067 domain-containing protein [Bacteroidota bacterium]
MTIDGTWVAIGAELGGQHIDDDYLSVITLTISSNQCEIHIGGNTDKGTLKFIPYVVPMAFDFTSTEGPNTGKIFKAIYKTAGGFLVVCYNITGGDRPKVFLSNPENQFYLVRYKR